MVTFSELETWPEYGTLNEKTRSLKLNAGDMSTSTESVREWPNEIGVGLES